ncbi:MAG: sulfite exporter TauE/SafE family protein [Pseudomonadota bacterium]
MTGSLEQFIGPVSDAGVAIVLVTVIIAGFLRGFLGFGGALIIIMVVNVVVGPQFAVPLACLAGLPPTLQLLPAAIRHSDRSFALPFGSMSLLMVPVGTLALVKLDPGLMKIIVSGVVLAMVLLLYQGWTFRQKANRSVVLTAGAVTGLIQGATGVAGPLVVAAAMAIPGEPEKQRANVIGAITFLSFFPAVPLWYHGMFTREVVIASLAIIPIYMITTWIGVRYFSGQGHRIYRLATLIALTMISLVTLWISVRDYIAV